MKLFKLKVSLRNQLMSIETKVDSCKTYKEIDELINQILKTDILDYFKDVAKKGIEKDRKIMDNSNKHIGKYNLKDLMDIEVKK